MSQMKAIVDKLLTDVSRAYVPTGMISELILPELRVKQYSGRIGKYGADHLRVVPTIMGGRGGARRLDVVTRASDIYMLETHGLEDIVTKEDYNNVEEPFDAEKDSMLTLTTVLHLGKEKALADTLRSTSIITQNVTLSGTSQFNDYTNSDPIGVAVTAKNTIRNATGVPPDTMIADWQLAETLRYHPKILRNLGYADNRAGSLTNDELAKALGMRRFLVADVVFNSAKEGQADSLSPMWGKDLILCVAPDKPQKMQKTLGYRIQHVSDGPRKVFKYAVNNPPDANAILVQDIYDMFIAETACAYLVKNAIA
jgi:hypothetical protein